MDRYFFVLVISMLFSLVSFAQKDTLEDIAQQPVEEIFKVPPIIPQFPGCENLPRSERDTCAKRKLNEYLQQKIKFPEELKVGGRVIAEFRVEKNGHIEEVKIIKSLCKQCDSEVTEAIKNMPLWTPMGARGRSYRILYKVSVIFRPG